MFIWIPDDSAQNRFGSARWTIQPNQTNNLAHFVKMHEVSAHNKAAAEISGQMI